MTGPDSQDRVARAALTCLAEPAHPVLGLLLKHFPPSEVLAVIRSGTLPAKAADALDPQQAAGLRTALPGWRARLSYLPPDGGLGQHAAGGIRLVCPGDPGWPIRLDDLGAARPYALWVRGPADLPAATARSVAVIGARAATAYGSHVCTELASGLAAVGWAIISGAAYGIDAAAHRGALAVDGTTIAVLACGPDIAYPQPHRDLIEAIAARGSVVSEAPPGTPVSRQRFLLRNRIIVALASATVIVEAARRSGTLSAARHAVSLARPLMAVPGPVTSATSQGCHDLIRDRQAICVTTAEEVAASLP